MYRALGVSFIIGVLVAYVSLFRAYKLALEKHEALTALLNNPKARVAAGKKAQEILKAMQEEEDDDEGDDEEEENQQDKLMLL